MALPPEPLDELLPQATFGVVASIVRITKREPDPPAPDVDPRLVDTPRTLPAQQLILSTKESLFGTQPEGNFEVLKPAGDYVLREGLEGHFLLANQDDNELPVILGRYGPDNYSEQALLAAIKAHNLS